MKRRRQPRDEESIIDRWPIAVDPPSWPLPVDYLSSPGFLVAGDFAIAYDYELAGVEVAGRYWLPAMFEALVDRPGLPRCQLRIGILPSGPVCLRLTLLGSVAEPLTSTRIRLPVGELVEEIVARAGQLNRQTGKLEREEFMREFLASIEQRPVRGKKVTDEFLREVAELYRYAFQRSPDRRRPTEAIAEAFQVSRSTAGRWLVEARKRGILEPALPGRAGEEMTDEARERRIAELEADLYRKEQ